MQSPSYIPVSSDVRPTPAGAKEIPRSQIADSLLTVDLLFKSQRMDAAAEYARRVSTPGDPLRGRFLTPQQFGDMFGVSQSDYNVVVAWARQSGLVVHETSLGRTILSVAGRASQIENAFRVQLHYYKNSAGKILPAATGAPAVPAEIAARLSGVVGLSKHVQYAPLAIRRPAGVTPRPNVTAQGRGVAPDSYGGSGPGGAYTPADFRTAYQIPTPAAAGPTETLAVFEQGGFYSSDVAQFLSAYKLPAVPVNVRTVNGYGGGVDDPGVEFEAVLDIDTLIGINPGAKQVIVYEDGEDFGVSLLDSLTAMANDHVASVISISYGIDEVESGKAQMLAENALFVQLAAQGQAVFVSSGDQGAYGRSGSGHNASDPGAQVFVTSVGGTALRTRADQTLAYESTWNDLGYYSGATGGGVSAFWKLPKYQVQPDNPKISVAFYNDGSNTYRNFPDIAADADPFTGASVYSAMNGGWLQVGGTSLSSPIYAGYASLYDQLHQISGLGHMGFFNPALYALGTTIAGYFSFNDIRDGSNGNLSLYGSPGYNAGLNFDDVTGWGTPRGVVQMHNLLTNAIPNITPPGDAKHITGTIAKGSATIKWTAAAGASGYAILAYNANTGSLVNSGATTGTQVTINGLPAPAFYAFYVESLSPRGATYAPALYLSESTTSSTPPVLTNTNKKG